MTNNMTATTTRINLPEGVSPYDNIIATIERNGRTAVAIFRADDFINSRTRNGLGLKWGSGKAWTITKIERAEPERAADASDNRNYYAEAWGR